MGSKGSNTTTTNQNQSYTANPAIAGAAGQAIQGAQGAAAQPFQMPVAPVAGFNPTQQQAFGQFGQAQNSWQPYFNQGAAYTNQSAAPITAADVSNVYNPMAANVTANLQDIFGQQNVQNQGNLTAQAGGVGADRIAVGMGNLAKEQTLGAGQTYANLYQQALQTAMQEKQLQAGAGSQFQAFGTGALGNTLQGAGALLGAGNQQQQQTQTELNAPYQNRLAQIAYQFQTPQYLAGIAGGLAPSLGGTTTGNQVTQAPQPSLMSQLLGIGTAGAGLYGAFGGFGGNNINLGNLGGGGFPSGVTNGYAEGGEVEDQGPALPGASIPKSHGVTPIPLVSLPAGSGHSGPLTGGINFPQPQTGGSHETAGGDISQALGIATKLAPFLLKRGGAVLNHDPIISDENCKKIYSYAARLAGGGSVYPRYDDGGGTDWTSQNVMGQILDPSMLGSAPGFNDRFKQAFPNAAKAAPPSVAAPQPATDDNRHQMALDAFRQAATPAYRLPDPKKTQEWREGVDADKETPAAPSSAPRGITNAPPASIMSAMMPQGQQPYPDSLKRDWGQNATRSPWMALVQAGATMAATPGPLGVSIGKGLLAGTAGLDKQRGELRNEQELNDKAQKLYQDAQVHLDKYNRVDANTAAWIKNENDKVDQSGTGIMDPKLRNSVAAKTTQYFNALVRMNQNELDSRKQKSVAQMQTEARQMAMQAHGLDVQTPSTAPAATFPPAGTTQEFDDGKGGKVTGVSDGTKWVPKQ